SSKSARMPSLHHQGRGYCYDSAPLLLPIGDLGPPVAVCPVAPYLAQPSCRVPSEARRAGAQQAQASALQRTQTICGSDPEAPLRSVCTRGRPSHALVSGAPRADAPDAPAPSCGGYLQAFLPASALCLSWLVGAGQPARQRPSQRWPVAAIPLYGLQ